MKKTEEDCANGWNEKIDEYVRSTKNKCNGYKWMHSRMSRICKKRSQWISGTALLLGVITSTGIFSTIFYCNEALTVQVITGIISVVSTFLVILQVKLDFAGLARDHHSASSKWGKIARDLEVQLGLPCEDREHGKNYVIWINKIYDSLIESSPTINNATLAEYRRKFPEEYTSSNLSKSKPSEVSPANKGKVDYRYRYEVDRFLVDNVV